MPVLAPDDVAAATSSCLGPLFDLCDRRPQDLVLDRLTVAIQILEPVGEAPCLLDLIRHEEFQCGARMAEPARSVDAGRQPEADLPSVDGGRIDVRNLHQRAQSRLLCPRQRSQSRDRQRAVLAHQRHDVGDRRERNEIEVAA